MHRTPDLTLQAVFYALDCLIKAQLLAVSAWNMIHGIKGAALQPSGYCITASLFAPQVLILGGGQRIKGDGRLTCGGDGEYCSPRFVGKGIPAL